MRSVVLFIVLVLVWSAEAFAFTGVLTDDTSMPLSGAGSKNAGAAPTLAVDAKHVALLRFDLAAAPVDVPVEKLHATLTLFISRVAKPGSICVAPVVGQWDEVAAAAVALGSSGDQVAQIAAGAGKAFVRFDVTETVKLWLTGAVANEGFAVRSVGAASATALLLDSKENNATGHRGELEIDFGKGQSVGEAIRGAWQAGSEYNPGDIVTFGGSTWITSVRNSGLQPGVPNTGWTVLAAKGESGPQGPAGPAIVSQPDVIWALGDSISAIGYDVPSETSAGVFSPISYLAQACLASNGHLRFGGVAATGGWNSEQVLKQHLPTVLAAHPRFCVVHCGTNDFGGTKSDGTKFSHLDTIANVTEIYDRLLAAGITPIGTSFLPKNSLLGVNAAIQQKLTIALLAVAGRRGIPFVDWSGVMFDPENGGFVGGAPGVYNADNVHQNAFGAKYMGQKLWEAVAAQARSSVWLPNTQVNGVTLFEPAANNGLLLSDGNGDGIPDGGYCEGSWTGAGTNLTSMGSQGVGNWVNLKHDGATTPELSFPSNLVTPGHRMFVVCRLKTAGVKAGGGTFTVFINDSAYNVIAGLANWTEDVELGVWYHEFTVPKDVVGNRLQFRVRVESPGATVSLGQIAIVDLADLGVSGQ